MLSFEERGRSIAILKGGKKNGELLSVADTDQLMMGFESIKIPERDKGRFEIVPSVQFHDGKVDPYRDVVLITGPSGIGKSTLCAAYAEKFSALFPGKPIYMFSRKTEDPAFDKVKLSRVRMDEDLIMNPIDIQSDEIEKNCLFIFDDYDTIPEEKVQIVVTKLVMDILETGRAKMLYCILTSHLLRKRNRNENDVVYNEIHTLVIPRKVGNMQMIRRTLENHFGIDSKKWKDICDRSVGSKFLIFGKEHPQYVLWDRGCFII